MAKRKKRRTRQPTPQINKPRAVRVATHNARPRLHVPSRSYKSPTLTTLDDRRRFHPAPFSRPAFALERSATRLVTHPNANHKKPQTPYRSNTLPRLVKFAEPKKVLICVRRERRKQVIHAKRIAGRSGLAKPRRNQFSNVTC